MCFITAGMGGGTGTGAAPIIAQAARELGVLTVGVVTKPFQFEGSKRMKQAEDGVEALQKVVDTLIIIPNQNLFRLANEKTTFTEAFAMADDVLYQGVKGVTDLMVRPGLINLDFADVRAVMDEMGKAMMGTGEASGEDRARQAAEKAIANPLLDEISLHGARGVLINITGGHDLTLFELDEAANLIREKVDSNANIIVGSTLDASMEGMMRVSVVATGIDAAPAAAETPVPRRRMAEPLHAPLRLEDEVQPAREPEELAPAAYAPEPTLFDGYAHHDTGAPIEAVEEDELPEPAYAPARQAAPQPVAQHVRTEAEQFVAPAPRAPGTPTPEAMARLRAAIDRKPAAPVAAPPRAEPAAQPAADARGGRFGINSLINRMTGHGGDTPQPAPRAQPAGPVRQERYGSSPAAPQPQAYAEDHEGHDAERDRIEIPAFLRRQAN
jgi:cell division protein FtsZ